MPAPLLAPGTVAEGRGDPLGKGRKGALTAEGWSLARLRLHLRHCKASDRRQLLGHLEKDPRRGARLLLAQLERRHRKAIQNSSRLAQLLVPERKLWRSGILRVAGVDEAGMGPLAGPVVAACVVFGPGPGIVGVEDSKRLSRAQRERLEIKIRARALALGVGVVGASEIDELNIYQAGLEAMYRAVRATPGTVEHLLVDARRIPSLAIPQEALVHGDRRSYSVAAASIVAKTARDRIMRELDRRYPGYGLARHKGYATREHLEALGRRGPAPIHRLSYPALEKFLPSGCPGYRDLRHRIEACSTPGSFDLLVEELSALRALFGQTRYQRLCWILSQRRLKPAEP